MPMQPPPMGGANPQNLEALAAAGDPRAMAVMQQRQALMQGAQGGAPPQGMPPQGGMPPMGPGGGAPPMQGAPGMSQAEFSGYGRPPNPDQEARKTQMLIQLLRQQQAPMGAPQ